MFLFKNTLLLNEFAKLGILFFFSLILSFFILFLSIRLTVHNPDSQKLSTYECGFEPYEDARNLFDVRFYLIAILFLIFDLETVYFYPWCVSLGVINSYGFWFMIDFLIELLIGYIYAWQIGALDWN
jgi:NADH-quinone oxidoreductase subunit A